MGDARNKQINEMIEATMKLAQSASALELNMHSCLYRMAMLELTSLADQQMPADVSRNRIKVSAK